MQISRLFEMVYLLMEKKSMTAKELAGHFEVSARTILRDVETLSMAGIPIYTAQGKGGGISLMEGFVLNKTTITEEEQNQILVALQGLSSTEHYVSESLLSKLGALFQKTDANWIEVDYSRWGNAEEDRVKFALLKEAVLGRQAVSFEYHSSHRSMNRRCVYPLKLVFKSREWYLQGYCLMRKDYRIFKINRIIRPKLQEEFFNREHFNFPVIESNAASYSSLVDLKLHFSANTGYRIYDELDESAVQEQQDGSFLVSISLPDDYWLYSFLLSFGAGVRVLEPGYVRENLIAELEKIKKQYQS